MTQPYSDRPRLLSLEQNRCIVDCGHNIRHTGYGDTDHSENDPTLGDGALPIPYLWDCQSSIQTLRGKHGGFSVEYG
jgi:hypothetical protein